MPLIVFAGAEIVLALIVARIAWWILRSGGLPKEEPAPARTPPDPPATPRPAPRRVRPVTPRVQTRSLRGRSDERTRSAAQG